VLFRFRDATESDLCTGACQEYDIDHGKISDLFKDRSGFVAQPRLFAHLRQTLPEHVGKEADEDVSLNAILTLVPDRTKV